MGNAPFIRTADGSYTIFDAGTGEHYHSLFGALQESRHVFLESGLQFNLKQKGDGPVSVLEVGFGTGLNFLLSAQYCQDNRVCLQYTGIEAFPLDQDLISHTGYHQYTTREIWDPFIAGYAEAMKGEISLSAYVQWEIVQQKALDFETDKHFDMVYFDAFSKRNQPAMWTMNTLARICRFLKKGGVFVTYAYNRSLKSNMQSLGFAPEKIPGAPGKREMFRGVKI